MKLPLRNNLGRFSCLLVEEIQNHLWEMLESGTIQPSHSVWCNAVVLIWKDGGL